MKAAIFDLDGVIVDNDDFHRQAFFKLCASYNLLITESEYREKVIGGTNEAIMIKLFGKLTSQEVEKRAIEKESIYRQLYASHIQPLNGLIKLLDALKENGISCAIGSNAPVDNIDFVLDKLNLRDFFKAIVHPGLGLKGKPEPAIFLKASELLQVEPDSCIVFDDSKTGLLAGIAAKMKVVGVLTTHKKSELPICNLYIKDFAELTVAQLNEIP
jgi:HAD superfamily hydrolase (TIGR01509 family)